MKAIAGAIYLKECQSCSLLQSMLGAATKQNKNLLVDSYSHKNIELGAIGGKIASADDQSLLAAMIGRVDNINEISQALTAQKCALDIEDPCQVNFQGYKLWELSLFDSLTGEFAIAILDQRKKKLLLCRDRIGQKPLYWFQNSQVFLFATELKAILATGAVPLTPALDSLSSYLYFGYIPQEMTPISSVNKLLPAHFLQLHLDGSKAIKPYWSLSACFENKIQSPAPKTIADLDEMMRNAIKRAAPKNEPIGCFFSNGLASQSMAYFASSTIPKKNLTLRLLI